MMIKKIKKIMIFVGMMHLIPCAPITVVVTNDADDILRSNRVWVRIGLASDESGVLKNSLQFSTDCSDMRLTSWHPLIESTSVYVDAFKKRKRLLVGHFAGWLACEYHASLQQLKNEQSLLYVSGFIVRPDGSVGPFMCSCPLVSSAVTAGVEQPLLPAGEEIHTPACIQQVTQNLEQEFVTIESSQRQWEHLWISFAAAPLIKIFMLSNLFMWLWWIVAALMHYRRWRWIPIPRWARRDLRLDEAFCFLLMLNVLVLIGYAISFKWAISIAALCCCCVFLYVLMVPGPKETLWGRFKNLMGTTCGISMVPLAIKALLLFYGIG